MRKLFLSFAIILLVLSICGCNSKEITIKNENGLFVIEGAEVPEKINYETSSSALISLQSFVDLKEFESSFYQTLRDEKFFDKYLIISGKKIASKSYFKDNDDNNSIIKSDGYTLTEIEVTKIFDQRGETKTEKADIKVGDIVTIYEFYYFKPTGNGDAEFVLHDIDRPTPIIKKGDENLFYLRYRSAGFISINKENLGDVWYNFCSFVIDNDVKKAVIYDDLERFDKPQKHYSRFMNLYPELLKKYY